MTYYCSVADVGSRIGLDSQQRVRAESRINRHIRQSAIYIDQEFLDFGRAEPSKSTAKLATIISFIIFTFLVFNSYCFR